jgi:hypothetical protein
MSPVGFEPTISSGERPQTYGLDRAATGIGKETLNCLKNQYQNLVGINRMLTVKSALDICDIKKCEPAYSKRGLRYK